MTNTFDYTMLSTFLLCRRKYYYRMVQGLESILPSIAPEFGRCIHMALDAWYEDKDVDKAKSIFDTQFIEDPDDTKRTKKVAFKILELYHEQYRDQPIQALSTELVFKFKLTDTIAYMGRMDKVISWDKAIYVMDHKTTSGLTIEFFNNAEPNAQYDGYIMAARQLGFTKCGGVVTDAILVAKGILEASTRSKLTPLARHISTRTDVQLNIARDRAVRIATDIVNCGDDMDRFYQNTDGCQMWRTSCPYRKLCLESDPAVRRQVTEECFKVNRWNPLKGGDNNGGVRSGADSTGAQEGTADRT